MINPNRFATQKMQQLGQGLFQGEEMAQQMSEQKLDQPVLPPGSIPQSPYGDMNPIMNKDSREARRQERKNIRMANKGLRQERRQRVKDIKAAGGPEEYSQDGYHVGEYDKKGNSVEYGKTPRYSKKNPPDGSDASFGISGYVNNKKEFKSALNQNDPDKKMFLVNKEKLGDGRDTLFLPPDTYVSKSGYAEDSDIEKISRKAAADNIYNYTKGNKNYNFEYLISTWKLNK